MAHWSDTCEAASPAFALVVEALDAAGLSTLAGAADDDGDMPSEP